MIFQPYKAILRIGLVVLVLALLVTACQQNPDLPAPTAQMTPSGSTPSPVAVDLPAATATTGPIVTPTSVLNAALTDLKGQEVIFWNPWQGDLAKAAADVVNRYNLTNPYGLKVRMQAWYSSGALYDALDQALQDPSAERPSLIAASSEQLAGWANGSQPALIDLLPYLQNDQVGLSQDEMKAYSDVFWAQDHLGSRQIGLPALRSAQVLFYNQTWAEDLGFQTAPKTPDEFKKQACEAAKKNNTSGNADLYGTGGWLIDTDAITTLSWLTAFNAKVIPSAEGLPYTFESKQSEQALTFLRGMLADGCAWLARNPAPYEYFSQRRALFYTGSLADLPVQAHWQELQKSKDEWTILPFMDAQGKAVVFTSGYSYGILRGKPAQQFAAWVFARWLSQPEVAARFIQAWPSIPVSSQMANALPADSASFPWNKILPLADQVRPAPGLASWRTARRLLEDAGWQVYHQTDDRLPSILPQLDQAVQEFTRK